MPDIHTIFDHSGDDGFEGHLGIDRNGRLYWNGREVLTRQEITLQWGTNIAVVVTALSTFALALFTALEFFGYGS